MARRKVMTSGADLKRGSNTRDVNLIGTVATVPFATTTAALAGLATGETGIVLTSAHGAYLVKKTGAASLITLSLGTLS